MTKTKFDTASVDVSVSGVIRNCKLIIDSETKLPWFQPVWLLMKMAENRVITQYRKSHQKLSELLF